MKRIDTSRLKEVIAENGASQSDIARYVGVTPAAVQQIVSGKTRWSSHLAGIAKYLNVHEAWLLGESEDKYDDGIEAKYLSAMPFYTMANSHGADFGPFIMMEYDIRFLPFPNPAGAEYNTYECFTGIGDEMAPTMLNDDRVIIDLTSKKIDRHDGIWFVYLGDRAMFRRAARISGGMVRFYADDPQADTFMRPIDDATIFGRVVWASRTFP